MFLRRTHSEFKLRAVSRPAGSQQTRVIRTVVLVDVDGTPGLGDAVGDGLGVAVGLGLAGVVGLGVTYGHGGVSTGSLALGESQGVQNPA